MKNEASLDRQVREFHRVLTEFVKRYQTRNRNDICCEDVTVAQCHTMEALSQGALAMNELARRMRLSISTMTRTVDQLVDKGYAARYQDSFDRRVWYATLTERGKEKLIDMDNRIMEYEKSILSSIRSEDRDQVIRLLVNLTSAVDNFRKDNTCCVPAGNN